VTPSRGRWLFGGAFTQVPNALGAITPAEEIIDLAHVQKAGDRTAGKDSEPAPGRPARENCRSLRPSQMCRVLEIPTKDYVSGLLGDTLQ